MTVDAKTQMRRQAISISLALVPFGIVFGVASAEADLTLWEAIGFSSLVFTGGTQFAAVETLGDGGAVAAAVSAGLLLSLRSLAYGVIMAPALAGPLWRRVLDSQLMIDESIAVATTQKDHGLRRFGYLWGGGSVFVGWNLMTIIGFLVFSSAGDLVRDLGLDAAIPAAFLALLWPRLAEPVPRACAAAGALIAAVLLPLTPPGIPILAAGFGVLVARWFDGGDSAAVDGPTHGPNDGDPDAPDRTQGAEQTAPPEQTARSERPGRPERMEHNDE